MACTLAVPQLRAQPEAQQARAAVAAVHSGEVDALAELGRCGAAGLRVLLADLATQIDAGVHARVNADLRALSALRSGDEFVVARLLTFHDELPQEQVPGPRVQVLHTLADVVLWSDDAGAALVQAWLERVPRSAFDTMLAGRELARVRFSEERERVRARFEVRRIDAVDELVARLGDPDLDVAEAAAEKLARRGPLADAAVQKLMELMDAGPSRPVERIRIFNGELSEGRVPLRPGLSAARAIVAVAPGSAAAATAHGRILEFGRSDERIRNLMALRGFDEVPAAVLRQVSRLAEQRLDAALRREALLTLVAIGGDSADVRIALEAIVTDTDDPQLAQIARRSLSRFGGVVGGEQRQAAALFGVTVDGKHGFIDAAGELVIEPTFAKAYPFREGLAAVQVGELWGYIDTRGRMVIEPRFAMPGFFSEGLASCRDDFHAPWGYIDAKGQIVIGARFDTAGEFHNGIAKVGLETDRSKALAQLADVGMQVEHRFIDRTGEFVSAVSATHFATGEPDELILFQKNGRWGYLDADGKVVIEPRYVGAMAFSDGLACVRLEGLFGFIDKTGRFVIEPQFQYASSFSEGLAGVPLADKGWGFIDTTGKVVIEPRFHWIYGGFRHGLAEVVVNGAVGYVDQTGAWVWRPRK